MNRVIVVALGLALCSVPVLAGEFLMNEEVAYGLRVTLSEPVTLTYFGDVLMTVSPQGEASVFTFSGAELPPWVGHGLAWTPASARIESYEWLSTPPAVSQDPDSLYENPVVEGTFLNPDFFAHPAYVMQGVDDRDAIFALPLLGVAELGFYPTVPVVDPGSVVWSAETAQPDGIGVAIEDDTLFIWGSNASWAGYGEVILSAQSADDSASVTIPATVFGTGKTLVNAQGKKDYFVPWSPQLDINRILSVEEHMRKYNKDEGELDRTIQWSRWKRMEFQWDIDLSTLWLNEYFVWGAVWPASSQLALVDVFLAEIVDLGIQGIRSWNEYYIPSRSGHEISPIYDHRFAGPTKRAYEEAYIVNEAHRLGLTVMLGNSVSFGNPSTEEWEEIYAASPTDPQSFFRNFKTLNADTLVRWQALGVDAVDLCPGLSSLNQYDNTEVEAQMLNDAIEDLVKSAREEFSGPLYHGAHFMVDFFPGQSILRAPFWDSFDIIAMSGWNIDLTGSKNPSYEQLVEGWRALISQYFQSFQQRFDKPFIMWENGSLAVGGCANYGLICSRTDGFDPNQHSTADMAMYYTAQAEAFQVMDGYFGPGWFAYPLAPDHQGGARDATDSTPRLKIEDTIQRICLGSPSPRVIEIDGDDSDWREAYVLAADPRGDAAGGDDFTGLAFVADAMYMYFKLDFASFPDTPAYIRVFIDAQEDGFPEWVMQLNNIWAQTKDWFSMWTAFLHERNVNTGPRRGVVDSIEGSNFIELGVARRFFGEDEPDQPFRIKVAQYDSQWKLLDEMGWLTVESR
jgi:hypothetical protein